MFVLQQNNDLMSRPLFVMAAPPSDGFNYTGDLDEATLYESSNEALIAFAKRTRKYPDLSPCDFELVEVAAVPPRKRKAVEIVRVL